MNYDDKEKTWEQAQERIAEASGLAVVLVEGEESATVLKSNNNSICEVLYNSEKFAPCCAKYCGKAVETAHEAGKPTHVKCHADLNFLTVPLQIEGKKAAAIVGRGFLNLDDYRRATERAATGEWQQFSAAELFENALLARSTKEMEKAAKQIEQLSREMPEQLETQIITTKPDFGESAAVMADDAQNESASVDKESSNFAEEENQPQLNSYADGPEDKEAQSEVLNTESQTDELALNAVGQPIRDLDEVAAWRSFFGSLLELEYKNACASLLDFLWRRYGISDLAWLERRQNQLNAILGTGKFENHSMQIKMSADDARLLDVLKNETALELRERKENSESAGHAAAQVVWLFPIAVGGEIRAALIVGGGDRIMPELKRNITRFNRQVAPQIEILRLRDELQRQSLLSAAARKFNESLQIIETEDFWTHLAQFCAELMRAERSSLLFFDDNTQKFVVEAATGNRADFIRRETEKLGEKVARRVFQNGNPLLVRDLEAAKISPAPPEWNYRTDSFISYPITISGRKIGVLNVTDKTSGERYDDFDLEMLHSIAPQLAVALDRATLKRRAGELEQLSVTDPLTGLYNRRYLEARLTEEINRSQRHGFPMSFLMIDVDEFKSYNDRFLHLEGDKALQIVARHLKESLRGADVAARYGGEEFSILLPQTTLKEARIIAERIRQKIDETEFPNRKITISIGVSTCASPNCTPHELKTQADKALYRAKARGRNRVEVYGEEDQDENACGGAKE